MMVRLDKILHMITCFKSAAPGLEDDQYSTPPKDIRISIDSERVMKRMGVFNNNFDVDINRDIIVESIPYGREQFLLSHLVDFSRDVCTHIDPECASCEMNAHCDFHNNKNDWIN